MASEIDRRMYPRTSLTYTAKARNLLDDIVTEVILVNASAQGIQFKTRKFMIEDDQVSLMFKYPTDDRYLTMEGKIVWSKSKTPNLWNVGFQFYDIPFVKIQEMFRLLKISG